MATIHRSDVIQKAVNDLAISVNEDKVPTDTLDKIQLIYSLNAQRSNFVASVATTATGTQTITLPTIDSRSRIFLTGCDMHIIKDATCDIASGPIALTVTPIDQGITKNIIQITTITLTAQSEHATLSLPYPLELKPNTNITINGTFTVGAMSRCGSVVGYTTSSN